MASGDLVRLLAVVLASEFFILRIGRSPRSGPDAGGDGSPREPSDSRLFLVGNFYTPSVNS
jgi:hypothetical protein